MQKRNVCLETRAKGHDGVDGMSMTFSTPRRRPASDGLQSRTHKQLTRSRSPRPHMTTHQRIWGMKMKWISWLILFEWYDE